MSEPFIGEIRAFGFNYAPDGWIICDGSILDVSQFQALYAVIGNTYGGSAQTSFAVPNLMRYSSGSTFGRAPMGSGKGTGLTERTVGEMVGTAAVTLDVSQIPAHRHTVTTHYAASTSDFTNSPTSSSYVAFTVGQKDFYHPTSSAEAEGDVTMTDMLGYTGGSEAHGNMQPYLTVEFCIASEGIFPSRT